MFLSVVLILLYRDCGKYESVKFQEHAAADAGAGDANASSPRGHVGSG